MANDVERQSGQLNLTVVALVAVVAIVGLVALVLAASSAANGVTFASATNNDAVLGAAGKADIVDAQANVAGSLIKKPSSLCGNPGGAGSPIAASC